MTTANEEDDQLDSDIDFLSDSESESEYSLYIL